MYKVPPLPTKVPVPLESVPVTVTLEILSTMLTLFSVNLAFKVNVPPVAVAFNVTLLLVVIAIINHSPNLLSFQLMIY